VAPDPKMSGLWIRLSKRKFEVADYLVIALAASFLMLSVPFAGINM
jgi:hypothetical protein